MWFWFQNENDAVRLIASEVEKKKSCLELDGWHENEMVGGGKSEVAVSYMTHY